MENLKKGVEPKHCFDNTTGLWKILKGVFYFESTGLINAFLLDQPLSLTGT
jgi:hypothetical protein